ncbi:MAG TPA: hypothetical protein VM370_13820 [Candidatus Thermoplasmatota archaeon]|nr:hypothetical protein [Candidatus Thermoplasmatota archaeon]
MRSLVPILLIALLAAGCLGAKEAAPPTPAVEGDPVTTASAPDDGSAAPPPSTQGAKPSSSNATSGAPASGPANASAPPAGAAAAPPPANAPPPPRVAVSSWNGSLTALGGGPGTPAAQAVADNAKQTFDVAAGLQGIVVELVWSDEHFDLDLGLSAPDASAPLPPDPSALPETSSGHTWSAAGGTPGAPDRHATILITDADALGLVGTWTWDVYAKGPVQASFVVYLSLFYDSAPPGDYSAVAAPAAESDNP